MTTPLPADRGVTIVAATRADVPLILSFIRQLAESQRLGHEVVATEADLETALFGAHPVAEVVLASVADEAVGFAVFFPAFSTLLGRSGLYLEDLFVVPAARGRGVGRALLAWLAREVLARGGGRLEWAALDWNARAIQFYERVGARALDERTTYRLAGAALEALAGEAS